MHRRPTTPSGVVVAAAACGFGLAAVLHGLMAAPLPIAVPVAAVLPPKAMPPVIEAPPGEARAVPPAMLRPVAATAQADIAPSTFAPLAPIEATADAIEAASVAMPTSWPIDAIPLTDEDREALGRVAYAEAANQGEAGIAAVVYTVLNRVASGRFEPTVQAVINAPRQFEPVMRAGGDWRSLPALSPERRVVFATILNLILDHRLPDPTNGALYFQNPAIVAARAEAGTVRPDLVHFGGQTPTAVIRDHSFYAGETGPASRPRAATPRRADDTPSEESAAGFEAMLSAGGGDLFGGSSGIEPTNEQGLFVPVDHPEANTGSSADRDQGSATTVSQAPDFIEDQDAAAQGLFVQ